MTARMTVVAVAVATIAIVAGCGGSASSPDEDLDLQAAGKAQGFEVFWLGESFAGYPITGLEEERSDVPSLVLYGTCEVEGGSLFSPSDGGCGLPVTLRSSPTCEEHRGQFAPRDRPILRPLRGAQSGFNQGDPGHLYVYTGTTTIEIYATRRLVERAATVVRPILGPDQPGQLDPPAPGSLTGKLPCQGRR